MELKHLTTGRLKNTCSRKPNDVGRALAVTKAISHGVTLDE